MAVTLTVSGTPYEYPQNGDNPGWGEAATAWAQAVTDVLNNIQGPGDILESIAAISDNVSTFTDILGFAFNTAIVRSFNAQYSVSRSDGSTVSVEYGIIYGTFNGTEWIISREFNGEAGMTFNVTNSGQVQYKSSSIGGTYSGDIKFKASTFSV